MGPPVRAILNELFHVGNGRDRPRSYVDYWLQEATGMTDDLAPLIESAYTLVLLYPGTWDTQ